MATVPGTDIEIGKWYPANIFPPDLRTEEYEDKFDLILGIKGLGTRSGYFNSDDNFYYWYCERYDSFDDEPIKGWTREQEINNNLEWETEKARGVSSWIIIPDLNDELPSYDGSNYYDSDPDEVYATEDDEDYFYEFDPGFEYPTEDEDKTKAIDEEMDRLTPPISAANIRPLNPN